MPPSPLKRSRHLNRLVNTLSAALALIAAVTTSAAMAADPETEARAVMAAFMETFNARDEARWADTLQFPHVRLASGTVTVYPDKAAFVAAMDLDSFAADSGWHHSAWDDMRVIQVSPTKVHIAVVFSRFRADNSLIASFDSLYVIEQIDGRWGVRARSSFAP